MFPPDASPLIRERQALLLILVGVLVRAFFTGVSVGARSHHLLALALACRLRLLVHVSLQVAQKVIDIFNDLHEGVLHVAAVERGRLYKTQLILTCQLLALFVPDLPLIREIGFVPDEGDEDVRFAFLTKLDQPFGDVEE